MAALSVGVTSNPKGAVVYCNGRKFGITPTTVEINAHEHSVLRLTKPGYETVETEIDPDIHNIVVIDLAPIAGFEGTWKRPDGTLRVFKRKGERVAGYEVAAVGDNPKFLHFFEFTPAEQDGTVVFGAVKDFVDRRAANEISCHIPLHAQYRYTAKADRLELRLEEVSYDFAAGHCLNPAKTWSAFEPLDRLAAAGTRTRARSTAGVATPNKRPPVKNGEGKSKKKSKKQQSKALPQKKKTGKPTFEDSNRVPNEVQQQAAPQGAELQQVLPPPGN